MFLKYTDIKKITLFLLLVFFSLLINAQSKDDDSATRYLSRELENVKDSVEEPPPAEEKYVQAYQDETDTDAGTNYFLKKEQQSNGGGPDSVQYRRLPDSLVKKMQADDDFWYANYAFEKEKKPELKHDVPFVQRPFFQTILWILIIGSFVAVLIMYLANGNAWLFRKAGKTIKEDTGDNIETDNIFEINYQQQIDKAISSGNYRLAVRLMFLRLLKNLSDKKIIDYKQDRTNFDYLLQVQPTKHYNDFFRLTRFYEYSWYGQFDIEAEKFPVIKNDFDSFERNIKQG